MALTYRQLLRETAALARSIGKATETHKKLAAQLDGEAKDTGRIAEQIAALKVDASTIAETREVSRLMQGLSTTARSYASVAVDASRTAAAAERQARTDHGGINQAVDSAPVPMAASTWYTQE